jgi:PST family polysaccharide transporter
MLPLGLALVVFAWVAPAAIPFVFGQLWSPALDVFPFIAFGYLAHALVTMQISALFVVRRHLEVAAVHALHLCMFAATAAVLVQRIGVVGYGAGEMAATLPFIWVQRVASRQFASPIHRTAVVWFIAFGAACFVRLIGWWMAIPLLLVLVSPSFWRDLRRLVRLWLDAWRPGRDLAEEGHGDGQEAPLRSGHRIDPAGQ